MAGTGVFPLKSLVRLHRDYPVTGGQDMAARICLKNDRALWVINVIKTRTAVGVHCKDGVLLGADKLVEQNMIIPDSDHRVYNVTLQNGMVGCGWMPDARHIIYRARAEAKGYLDNFGIKIPGHVLANKMGHFVHMHTQYGLYRPFGAAIIMANYDELRGYSLYMIEPSGQTLAYNGCAVGKGKQLARTEIEKLKFDEITCREAAVIVAKVLLTCHEEMKDKKYELDLSWVCDESEQRHQLIPNDVKAEIIKQAEEMIEKEEEEN